MKPISNRIIGLIVGIITAASLITALSIIGGAGPLLPVTSTPVGTNYEQALRSTVKLVSTGQSASGSGVVLSNDGFILTNAHVCAALLDGAEAWRWDGTKLDAEIVWATGPEYDLCVVDADGIWEPAAWRSTPAEVGEEVFAIGMPSGTEWTITWGHAGGIHRGAGVAGQLPPLHVDLTIAPGSSGGPVFDKQGQVVALINSGLMVRVGGPFGGVQIPIGINWAIPNTVILPLLRLAP